MYPRVRDARAQDGAIKCFMIIITIDDIMIETFLDLGWEFDNFTSFIFICIINIECMYLLKRSCLIRVIK